jgi:hypothetical protein
MTEDCLHCLHVSRCSQHLHRERAPAAVGRTLLYPGLTVEPGDRLLQSITCPVHLWPAVQLTVFEREFEGLPLVCHDQL